MTDAERTAIEGRTLLLFDGLCRMCNGTVRFLMRHDRAKRILYAPLEGALGQEMLARMNLQSPLMPEGMVLIEHALTARQVVSSRSQAMARVLGMLGRGWRIVGTVLSWVPRGLREWGYGQVARWRYRLFGRHASCLIPNAEERGRILSASGDSSR